MYESQVATEWAYILKDCGAKAVIVANDKIRDALLKAKAAPDEEGTQLTDLEHIIVLDSKTSAEAPDPATQGCITWSELLERGRKNPIEAIHPTGKDIACFIYTSGTTGKPKGVKLSHTNLASNVSAMNEVFPMSPEDRSLSFLPWAHSFGQTVELHGLFSMGASMGIAEAVDKIIANLSEVQPTLLFSVPRIFNRIYDSVSKKMAEESSLIQGLFKDGLRAANRQRDGETLSTVESLKLWVARKLIFGKIIARFGGNLKYAFSGGAALSKDVAN